MLAVVCRLACSSRALLDLQVFPAFPGVEAASGHPAGHLEVEGASLLQPPPVELLEEVAALPSSWAAVEVCAGHPYLPGSCT